MHQKEFTSNPNSATTNIFRDLQIFTLILASTLTLPLVAATATAPCFADSFPKHRKRPNAMQVHQSENDHDDDGWETVPSSKKKNKSLSEQRKPADDGTLPWVEFLPPQIQQQQKSFTPFLLLMVGIPGSGKSTFAKSLEKAMPYKFVRINQDELGDRRRCEEMTRKTLANGQCPVIDRCNFDPHQRAHFVNIVEEHNKNNNKNNDTAVLVDCVVLTSDQLVSVEECVRRCQQRKKHETLSSHEARGVVTNMARQMIPPLVKGNREGIRSVRCVVNADDFSNAVREYLEQTS